MQTSYQTCKTGKNLSYLILTCKALIRIKTLNFSGNWPAPIMFSCNSISSLLSRSGLPKNNLNFFNQGFACYTRILCITEFHFSINFSTYGQHSSIEPVNPNFIQILRILLYHYFSKLLKEFLTYEEKIKPRE